MPIIKIKNPNYVDGSGEEKWIDAAIYTNLANEGVEEAPNNGKDYVRRDSDWVISNKIYDELGITKARFESLLNNAYIIPTLGAVPDENTLVYVDGEYNVNFKIGDYCRVANPDSEYGYDFFRLYDIKDGLAVWSTAETEGGGSTSGETVLISLISNQSTSDNALLGASILVYDVTADLALSETTWQGSEIMVNIPKEHTYTVNVGAVTGYKTPATKTFGAVNGATRILNMQYDCTILTVNFSSNHNANVSSAKATVSYGSTSTTVTNRLAIKVPYDSLVSITCSKILYYLSPTIATFTAGSTTKEVNAEYITSFLVVNYTKNLSVGGTPSISVVTEGTTRTYSANMICAPGEQVTINFWDITYYKTPAAITFTKGVGTETKLGDYLSEKITVSLSTDDSKVVTNQVITLTCSSNSSYNKTYTCTSTATTGDSGFIQYIPYGYRYTISISDKYSYNTPSSLTYTANTTTRNTVFLYVYATYTIGWELNYNYRNISVTLDGETYDYSERDIQVPALAILEIPHDGNNYAWCILSSRDDGAVPCYTEDWSGLNIKITKNMYVKHGAEVDSSYFNNYYLVCILDMLTSSGILALGIDLDGYISLDGKSLGTLYTTINNWAGEGSAQSWMQGSSDRVYCDASIASILYYNNPVGIICTTSNSATIESVGSDGEFTWDYDSRSYSGGGALVYGGVRGSYIKENTISYMFYKNIGDSRIYNYLNNYVVVTKN